MKFLVGTYTRKTASDGIYTVVADEKGRDAKVTSVCSAAENPSWLVQHPAKPVVYSVVETSDDNTGAVCALRLGPDNSLQEIGRMPTMGSDPCHLLVAFDRLFVSNYSGGNLAVFDLMEDGDLGELVNLVQHSGSSVDPMRQKGAHVHSTVFHDGSNCVYVCDLGLDRVYRYPVGKGGVDVMGRRTMGLRPGAGPRMMAIDPAGQYGYVINELDNTIVSFDLLATPRPVELSAVSALPDDFTDASYTAHIAMTKDGRFLYASNRGHDSVAVFRVDEGCLTPIQHCPSGGRHPRFFCLTNDEEFLIVANRDSDNLVMFARDDATGEIEPTGTEITIPAPVCLTFL